MHVAIQVFLAGMYLFSAMPAFAPKHHYPIGDTA